jgi:hypothetical protein
MRRLHLIELEDQPWLPATIRNYMTDLLNYMVTMLGLYDAVVPVLYQGLAATGAREILDICSGGGGPLRRIHARLAQEYGLSVRVRLSDLYPNHDAFHRAVNETDGAFDFIPTPVDATNVPAELGGFRTLFTCFHHFKPEDARRILQDAVDKRCGIGIFEFTERSPGGLAFMLAVPTIVTTITPFIRPFRWRRLLFTYPLPVAPAALWFDGVVSQLRTYTPDELRDMTRSLTGTPYHWEIGQAPHRTLPAKATYLVGYPA